MLSSISKKILETINKLLEKLIYQTIKQIFQLVQKKLVISFWYDTNYVSYISKNLPIIYTYLSYKLVLLCENKDDHSDRLG